MPAPLVSETSGPMKIPIDSLRLSTRRGAIITLQLVALQVGFGIAIGIVQAIWNIAHHLPPAAAGNPFVVAVGNVLAFSVVLRREIRMNCTSLSALGNWRIDPVLLLAPVIFIVLGVAIGLSELENITSAFAPKPNWLRHLFEGLSNVHAHPFSTFFCLSIVAPVTEELLFRGWILRGLLSNTTPVRAIMLSALLFAAMHLNPWQMPVAIAYGVFMGWIYLRTRSLLLCIFAHGLNNTLTTVVSDLPFKITGFNISHPPGTVLFQPWWFDVIGLLLIGIGVFAFHRLTPRAPGVTLSEEPPLLPPMPEAGGAR
jgi:membrane protease YdiL (CAAX protease family)